MGEYIDNKTKTSQDKVSNDKLKTSFAKIIVEGTSERPFYEILYFDPSNNDFYIGFGSYCLEYVIKWFNEEFEIDKSKVFDVAPVVHGKWIPVEAYGIGNTAKCSECEKRQYGYDGFKFCPNCGAKMLEGVTMGKCRDCLHFEVCKKYDAIVDFDVDDGVCLYFENKIVRCIDCKYLEISGCYGECGMARLGIVHPDDYCSLGERKYEE